MNNRLRDFLNLRSLKLSALLLCIVGLIFIGIAAANSFREKNKSESSYIEQDISEAEFISQKDFPIKIEQDSDTPLKILEANVKTISANEYQRLTSKETALQEIVSVPKVKMQNVSNKTIVGITLMLSDKAANLKRGIYIKEQSVKPGQFFTILPENFVPASKNPAQNPKFWLDATDKSKIGVRIVATFEDGTMWANESQR